MKALKYLPVLLLLMTIGLFSCGESGKTIDKPTGGNAPKDIKLIPGQGTDLQFSHLTMEFKPVISGDTIKAVYPFKNTTQTSQVIKEVVVSCPCMHTDYPKGNIQPGQIGEITVKFATAGQSGRHEKIIAVVLEGNQDPISLRLNGQINLDPNAAPPAVQH